MESIYINSTTSTTNKKPFWQFIKSRRQDVTGTGSLKASDGHCATEPTEKANILNDHFKSVYTIDPSDTIPKMGTSLHVTMDNINRAF